MILVLPLAALLVGALGETDCPEGFIRWDKQRTCYHISDIPATRNDAQMYCQLFDSSLVSINNDMENYFLKFSIKNKIMNAAGDYDVKKMKLMKGRGSFWTAGIHKMGDTQWTWQPDEHDTAESMDYTYWGAGQPNASMTWKYEKWAEMMIKWKMMHEGMGRMHKGGLRMEGKNGNWGNKDGDKKSWLGYMANWMKNKRQRTQEDSDSAKMWSRFGGRYQDNQEDKHQEGWGKGNWGQSMKHQQQQYELKNRNNKGGWGNRRGKRSLLPINWQADDEEYKLQLETSGRSNTEREDEPTAEQEGHPFRKHMMNPDLSGNNCTVMRKGMISHNISWYSVPCVEEGAQRFFICERPYSKFTQTDTYVDTDVEYIDYIEDNMPYSAHEAESESPYAEYVDDMDDDAPYSEGEAEGESLHLYPYQG